MSTLIDRRPSGSRADAQRDRLHRRLRSRIQKAVEEAAAGQSIERIAHGEKRLIVPTKDLHEPRFRHDWNGGTWDRVFPGNREFRAGDRIPKPPSGAGEGGSTASVDEGQETIGVWLKPEEFLDLLFDGLELPRLRRSAEGDLEEFQWMRSGFIRDGSPSRMHIGRTMRTARSRRLALRAAKKRALTQRQAECEELRREIAGREAQGEEARIERDRLAELETEIAALERQIRAIPFIDESDLRFAHSTPQARPKHRAVVFYVMDVSGSMEAPHRELAKRFFLLLYLFLERHYPTVETVFVKHHTEARECSEEAFFNSEESGGTVVSSALELVQRILHARYPADDWNVYLAQASDGDNAGFDNARVRSLMEELLPQLRAAWFLEVLQNRPTDLFHLYERIAMLHPHLSVVRASENAEIYPLFRELFRRTENTPLE
ncbi:YeaH/YhbH family protein [Acidithiobacillus caldus]|uniref:YeaH/YhbH family protein n=1 Tax=Acidithiobacillus caldus TaxID=33059 RepID=UPI001C07D7A1|nr:YeaH/YhbH family protein [Acidithiobacillus caldus]MBU2746119.1 YeaH/YhbH family protein [Acidithiobacillus caldus]